MSGRDGATSAAGLTTAALAALSGATLEGDGARAIVRGAPLADASARHVSVVVGAPGEAEYLARTRAGAVFAAPGRAVERADLVVLRHHDPMLGFARAVDALRRRAARPPATRHASADVAPDAEIADGVYLGPGVVIGPRARIGRGATIHAHCWIGADVEIAEGALLWPRVTVYPWVTIGRDSEIHAGAVLGADGHGYEPDGDGGLERPLQYGDIEIGARVEIGANATVGRGVEGRTRIGDGSKIGDLVTIAHDCDLGRNVKIIHQSGLASNVTVGDNAVLMGQVGVRAGVHIGADALVLAKSCVFGDVPDGEHVLGYPARPRREALEALAQPAFAPKLKRRVKELEDRLDALAGQVGDAQSPGEGSDRRNESKD